MRKNQKGFTLVELIIAVAILAIVTLAVCGFIVVGSKSYTSANTDIMLQQEAQLALNQISDVIIDTTDSISYSVGTSGGMQKVLKDSEYGGEATDKCLVVVNRNDTSSNNDNPSYWFYWNKDDEKIYFNEVPVDSTMDPSAIQSAFDSVGAAADKPVLAEHVTDLNIDISQFEENRVVMISMTLKNGNREYSTSNNVTVRNKIALNVVDIDPMKRADEFRIEDIRSVVLEPGDNYTFRPTVDTTSSDKDLEWVFVSGEANGTTVSQNGNDYSIHVGIGEVRENLTLRVTRKNEEYAGQKDRVAETVQVKVKRVNSVNLTASASTIKKGETVEITGKAIGWLLKTKCDSDLCASDDISKDEVLNPAKDVVTGWHFVEGSGTIESSDEGKAVIKIDQNMTGNTVTIEATSTLSATKNGGYSSGADTNSSVAGVQGRISFTVEEGMEAIPSVGDLRYGSDNDGNMGMIYDFLYANLSDYDHYVVCARLRETGNTNKDQDQVILYFRSDKNIRFTPDIFGADLHKDYDVYLQLLLPVDRALYEYNGTAHNGKSANQFQGTQDDNSYHNTQVLVDEYFGNLDSNGAYIGSKYEKTGQFFGSIGKPVLHFTCDGKAYPNTDPNAVTKYSLAGGYDSEAVLGAAYLDKDATVNIDLKSMNRLEEIMFTVYEGEGESINNWKYVAGYNPDTGAFNGSFVGGMFSVSSPNGKDSLLTDSTYLIKKNNSSGSWDEASGNYHVVLGYRFACDKNARGDYKFLAERNVKGDYAVHYYSNPEGSIKLVIESGLNLNVITNSENWWTNFPVPSDSKFPFDLKSSVKQTSAWSFKKYNASKQSLNSSLDNVKVECVYRSGDNSYDITLLYESINGTTVTTRNYGTYNCKYGGNEWTCVRTGGAESTKEITANLQQFMMWGSAHSAYFPTPSDSDFPFAKESTQKQTIQYNLVWFPNWGGNNTTTVSVDCTYDASSKTYTIRIYNDYGWSVDEYGTWRSNGTQWNKQS